MIDGHAQVLDIVRSKLDPATVAIIEAALECNGRLTEIRDAFLLGKDAVAVQLIKELDPIGIRKVVGLTSNVWIPGGAAATIQVRPQIPFTAHCLCVSPSISTHFMIDDIMIGNCSQNVLAGSMHAELFTTDIDRGLEGELDEHGFYTIKVASKADSRIGLFIDMPRCEVGQYITVNVTNVDHAGHPFRGALLGRCGTF